MPEPSDIAAQHRRNYSVLNESLDGNWLCRRVRHMNYGYALTGTDPNEVQHRRGPRTLLCRDNIRLLDQMCNGANVASGVHLDVSCGRGGTLDYIQHRWPTLVSVGLDISRDAFHSAGGIDRVRGDALALPFRDTSVDLLTNVEASHCYPDLLVFLSEVARVLRSGAVFVYGDVMLRSELDVTSQLLHGVGLEVRWLRDITMNVLLARSRRGRFQRLAFGRRSRERGIDNLCALPGTAVFDALANGPLCYVILSATAAGPHRQDLREASAVRPMSAVASQLLGDVRQ